MSMYEAVSNGRFRLIAALQSASVDDSFRRMLPINALLLSKGGASAEAAIRYGTMDSFFEAMPYAYGRTPPRRREGARRPATASARGGACQSKVTVRSRPS